MCELSLGAASMHVHWPTEAAGGPGYWQLRGQPAPRCLPSATPYYSHAAVALISPLWAAPFAGSRLGDGAAPVTLPFPSPRSRSILQVGTL